MTIDRVFEEVCRHTGVSEDDLLSRSRLSDICYARFMTIALLREFTDFTLERIGQFVKRKHPAVSLGLQSHSNLMLVSNYRETYNLIRESLTKKNVVEVDLFGIFLPNGTLMYDTLRPTHSSSWDSLPNKENLMRCGWVCKDVKLRYAI